jgi:hypothetical protein
LYDGSTSRWVNTGVKSAALGSTPNANGYSIVDVNVGGNRTERRLVLQPADSTNPGVLTTGAQSIAGDKTFNDDVIITGDLTVNGTTTSINTTNLEVEDQNILVNKAGNDASAEGAGITVERTGVDGSIVYEDALASKWKAGAIGAEIQIVNVSSGQTLTNKTIDADSNTITNIENADIKVGAAIDATKIADGTVTSTEFQYINTLSSNAQTQLNGKVTGPASATDNAIARYDSITGKLVKDSGVLIDNSNAMTGAASFAFEQGQLDVTGNLTWGAPIHGLLQEQDTVDQTLAVATIDHANNSTNAPGYILVATGSKPGASSTGITGPMYFYTGNNDGSGNSGEIIFNTGIANTGKSGNIEFATNTSTAGPTGDVFFTSGNASTNSGAMGFIIGTAGVTQGTFRLHKLGTTVNVGDLWTATHSDGRGYWSTPTAGANTSLSNLGTTDINADLIFNKANATVKTKDSAAAITNNILLKTGDGTGFASGTASMITGTSSTAATGNIYISSGNKAGSETGASGAVTILSGEYSSSSNSKSGDVILRSGDKSGSGTAATGDVQVRTGASSSVNGPSGLLTLKSGDQTGAGTATSGTVTLKSGDVSGGNKTSGVTTISTGTSGSGNSGSVQVTTGTPGAGFNSGAINLQTGSVSGGTRGNITLNGNLVTTASSFEPTANNSFNLGSLSAAWAGIMGIEHTVINAGSVYSRWQHTSTTPSGVSVNTALTGGDINSSISRSLGIWTSSASSTTQPLYLETGNGTGAGGQSGLLQIKTGNNSNASSPNNTGAINITTGNAAGSVSGNSGAITLQTGTVVAGTRGKIIMKDGSEGTAGHVWTSTGTAGEGAWAAAGGGGGADTSLSNLASPTTISQNLTFGVAAAAVDRTITIATPSSGAGKILTVSGGASNGTGSPGKLILAAGLGNGTGTVEQIQFNMSKVGAGAHTAYKGAVWEVGSTFTRLRVFSPNATDTTNGDLRFQTADTGQVITAGNAATGAALSLTINGQSATDANESSGTIVIETLGKGGSGTGATGALTIGTGANTSSGTGVTGSINITTGAKTSGTANSGNIVLTTGAATGNRGFINCDALFMLLPKQSADPTHGSLVSGAVYYNTTSNKIKMYNGATWETVTSV